MTNCYLQWAPASTQIMTIGWISYVIVWLFQMYIFMQGIDWIIRFLNWAFPTGYTGP